MLLPWESNLIKKVAPFFQKFSTRNLRRAVKDFVIVWREGQLAPKHLCWVVGSYFEKIGSTSFVVYSIAVTDAHNRTWFVKRYWNFEQFHRHLRVIPNYTLHLPPKRIFFFEHL